MKSIKKIIYLLVLASLGLSLTPLTTVQAADTKALTVQNSLDSTSSDNSTDSKSIVTALDATTDAADSKASNVSVTVLSGILTLDAVPDFNFGNMAPGSTVKLKSNDADVSDFNTDKDSGTVNAGIDGNKNGYLQVTDSRNLTDSSNMPGFQLTASIGQLQTSDNTQTLDDILHLNSLNLVNSNDENVSNSGSTLKTNDVDISSLDGKAQTVMNLKKGEYNPGVIRATYNTPDSANLTIPSSSSSSKEAKNMNAVVTWTLTASPSVTSN